MATAQPSLAHADADQVRMMEERVILTDYFDNVTGFASKAHTHVYTHIREGLLHRAFSVFLFTPDGKLILQQRSPAKITFPLIWANTCCSHPLESRACARCHGGASATGRPVPHAATCEQEETDAMGVKRAARRKLEHELGIPPEDVPLDAFTFITRVHYEGASVPKDPVSGAPLPDQIQWGEHEIDWILMCKPRTLPRIAVNPNEVATVRAFTQAELRAWMAEHDQECSPWFRVMHASLLYKWWDAVLAGDLTPVLERDVIHRQHDMEAMAAGTAAKPMSPVLMATLEDTLRRAQTRYADEDARAASAGDAAFIPGASAAVPKQGAYGKVPIHSESKLAQLSHLDEVWAALLYKLGMSNTTKVAKLDPHASAARKFCENMLCKVSRSFALVIQQLPDHLRFSVCVFYLVLRGLDTVEDDMETFRGRTEEKLQHLRAFHKYLFQPYFRMVNVGEGDEATLLRQFYYVNIAFAELPRVDQVVIADICARMGDGMASYVGRDLREGTQDAADYNMYCHYVAGLVGEGLSRLFVVHGDEAAVVAHDVKLADDMGLFLQKTNIIRDYLEDLVDGRAFWPREIWEQYGTKLSYFRMDTVHEGRSTPETAAQHDEQARACLNHLVADALTLAPSCLRYMSRLRTPDVFRFCAIPQVMAIATLDKLTNNRDVFTGVVKIRKGLALKLMNDSGDMQNLYLTFLKHARSIAASIPRHHKTAYGIATKAAAEIETICLQQLSPASLTMLWPLFSPVAVLAIIALMCSVLVHLYNQRKVNAWGDRALPSITDSWDVAALTVVVACIAYLFALAGVPMAVRLQPTAGASGLSPTSADSRKMVYDAFDSAPSQEAEGSAARRRTVRPLRKE